MDARVAGTETGDPKKERKTPEHDVIARLSDRPMLRPAKTVERTLPNLWQIPANDSATVSHIAFNAYGHLDRHKASRSNGPS